jgi:hypothetical protein
VGVVRHDVRPELGAAVGTPVPHPLFTSGGQNNTYDIAVILLDEPVTGIEPADLPRAGLLDRLKANHTLDDQVFTAVGYGTVRETKKGGPHGFMDNSDRRYALQTANALRKSWLRLSMQPSTGDGGTCYGDSGGPHFLGDETSNLVVWITVTGDAMCRATDTAYRLDTSSAREFLGDQVTLPSPPGGATAGLCRLSRPGRRRTGPCDAASPRR